MPSPNMWTHMDALFHHDLTLFLFAVEIKIAHLEFMVRAILDKHAINQLIGLQLTGLHKSALYFRSQLEWQIPYLIHPSHIQHISFM